MSDTDFELVAASLRADHGDLRTYVEALAAKLLGALPDRVTVQRGGFRGTGRVEHIEVELGELRYTLDARAGSLSGTRAHRVRGIVLKNEELPLERWIEALSHDLVAAAESSLRDREALERLLTA